MTTLASSPNGSPQTDLGQFVPGPDRLFDSCVIFFFGLFLFHELFKFRSDAETKERLDDKEFDKKIEEFEKEEKCEPVSVGKDSMTSAGFPFWKFVGIVLFFAVAWQYSGCFICALRDYSNLALQQIYGEVVEPIIKEAEPVKEAVKKVAKDVAKEATKIAQSQAPEVKAVKKVAKKVAKAAVKAAAQAAGVPVGAAGHKEL